MSLEELKIELIKQILETENVSVLNKAFLLLSSCNTEEEFTTAQRQALERGLADVEAGRVTPSAEVWKKFGR